MKIQEDLVFNKHTGELVGFVDLGDADLNFSTFKKVENVASHCMVFYLRGLASDLKFSMAYFATKGVTGAQTMTLFWKAVSILELVCNLNIIAVVFDGVSPNRVFFKLHKELPNVETNFTYRTINLFARDRYIYFFADVPHLMKTLRNAMYHAKMNGSGTRQL